MKLTIANIPIQPGMFEMQIRDPGVVRHIAFGVQPKLLVGKGGNPEFEEVAIMFVEVSPDGPLRNRRFAALKDDQIVDPKGNDRATWQATGVSPRSGAVVHVYEIREVQA